MFVDCPPTVLLPLTFWEYWTGILLTPSWRKHTRTTITFNPIEVADNLKKAGGVIPGITPGKSTSEYLNKILNYIVFIGAVGLLIIALIPIMCTGFFNASVSFGGTSIIIIVGVVLETLKQIESQMCNRYYKGFLSE